jgi:hypothetical protein
MASKFYLGYLKQIGFKTFNDFWPEAYDNEDGKLRYLSILALIDRLALLPMDELVELNNKMQHIVNHNYQLLTSRQFNKNVTKINL